MSMTRGMLLLSLCLVVMAAVRAADYQTAYKDPKGVIRPLHAEFHYRVDMSTTLGDKPPLTLDVLMDCAWDGQEKVLSVRNGDPTLTYEVLAGTEHGEVTGGLAKYVPKDKRKYDKATDLYTMQFRRAASGKVDEVKCVKGETPFTEGEDSDIIGLLESYMLLCFPFEYPLAFPATTGKAGDSWEESETIPLPTPKPVEDAKRLTMDVSREYTIDGVRQVDGKAYLAVTCTLSGSHNPELFEWEVEEGNVVAALVSGNVDGKATYLFDQASGILQRIDVELSAGTKADKEGFTSNIDETLTVKMEMTEKASKGRAK